MKYPHSPTVQGINQILFKAKKAKGSVVLLLGWVHIVCIVVYWTKNIVFFSMIICSLIRCKNVYNLRPTLNLEASQLAVELVENATRELHQTFFQLVSHDTPPSPSRPPPCLAFNHSSTILFPFITHWCTRSFLEALTPYLMDEPSKYGMKCYLDKTFAMTSEKWTCCLFSAIGFSSSASNWGWRKKKSQHRSDVFLVLFLFLMLQSWREITYYLHTGIYGQTCIHTLNSLSNWLTSTVGNV